MIGPGSRRIGATLAMRVTAAWLCGFVALLPIGIPRLPLNLTPVDFWIVLALPIIGMLVLIRSKLPSAQYLLPIWLILVASLVGSFAAPVPAGALLVIVKELFIFVWFYALILVLARVNQPTLHLTLNVWLWIAVAHGVLILVQFAVPDVWREFVALAGGSQEFSAYRPAGLSENANWAAHYQLLGFVPLALGRLKAGVAALVAAVLFCSVLATGSMAAILSLCAATLVAGIALLATGQTQTLISGALRLGMAVALIASALLVVVSADDGYRDRLESIVIGRADRSSAGRFDLWRDGIEVLQDQRGAAFGIGPENFRYIAEQGKQLHNDSLAFLVERGALGLLGLTAFFVIALMRACVLIVRARRRPDLVSAAHVVFLAAVVAAFLESQTHQVFHFRALWLVLAFQEAALLRSAPDDLEILFQS